jgi:CHAT domain
MTGQCELRVTVTGLTVQAELDTPDGKRQTFHEESIADYTDLRRDTVDLLELWVRRWVELTKSAQHALIEQTFSILGRQLYQVIFRGDIDQALREGMTAARRHDDRLRIRLYIKDDAQHLDRLPWEFLYFDGDSTDDAFFFSKNTDLQLYRSLKLKSNVDLEPCLAPLEVLFVLAMEDQAESNRKPYWTDVESLKSSMLAVERTAVDDDDQPLLKFTFASGRNVDVLERMLAEDPHVVHLVGHARIKNESTEIKMPGLDDALVWTRDDDFIQMLIRDKPRAARPRMVVLHLRQRQDFEFSDTFERLAPKLIKAGIPLVVAMQYPLDDQAADRFIQRIYGMLAKGQEIHVAVQNARDHVSSHFQNLLLLGTPVLYMQGERTRLIDASGKPTSPPESPLFATNPGVDRNPATSSLRLSIEKIGLFNAPEEDIDEIQQWIQTVNWEGPRFTLRSIVRQRARNDPFRDRRADLYMKMLSELASRDDAGTSQ